MIIVKKTNGSVLLNDTEIVNVSFDKDRETLRVTPKVGAGYVIHKVEGYAYVNAAQPTEYKAENSRIEYMQGVIDDLKSADLHSFHTLKSLREAIKNVSYQLSNIERFSLQGNMEEAKAELEKIIKRCDELADEDEAYFHRREWLAKRKEAEQKEADKVSELSDKLAKSDLDLEIARDFNRRHEAAIERVMHRNLWHRILNTKTYL